MRNPENRPKTVIEVKDLKITFRLPTGNVRAVRGLDFQLNENEVLALVVESSHDHRRADDGSNPQPSEKLEKGGLCQKYRAAEGGGDHGSGTHYEAVSPSAFPAGSGRGSGSPAPWPENRS